MGKGSGRGADMMSDHCLTFSVLILNVFCGVLGALVFILAIWMRLEGEVRDWIRDLEMHQYWTGLYILMAAGAIIIFISICGCTGALTGNGCLLATSVCLASLAFVLLILGSTTLLANFTRQSVDMERLKARFNEFFALKNDLSDRFLIFLDYRSAVLVLVALILELAGGIFSIVHGTQSSKLSPWLTNRFNRLIGDSNYNDRALDLLHTIQENVGCCGSYNYQDYDRARLPIPETCRDKITGNVYQDGCVKRFAVFIEKRTGWIAGIALFIGFMQVILVCLTFMFWKRIRDDDATEGYRGKTKYSTVATNQRY